ncbi:peptidoglycan DD-metalloendopeptidase family protein [Aquimarina sp. W85]|uniref:peptidoglycan DD-metalloendopeptidase family protein n=1 Tax=Aquimarina rhodophyticola TaxID=3342246 RepID=UPI003670BC67
MNSNFFKKYIENLTNSFTPVIIDPQQKEQYIRIDLSSSNKELRTIDLTSPDDFEDYVNTFLTANQGTMAYGGYLEQRDLYKRSTYFNQKDPQLERNIHLGLDIWCAAGARVVAPIKGRIHSFKNNTNFGDYGPTIILEHQEDGVTFFTLYGHLSLASLQGISVGQSINKGDVFAALGDATVNGTYAPHLHFQIIKELDGNIGDYPGVSNQLEVDKFKKNCPDPNLLLKIA